MSDGGLTLPQTMVFVILAAAFFLASARLIHGPSLPDRVVALDLMAMLAVGMTASYAAVTSEPALLDVSVLLALISFLGTVAFARYIEKGGPQ